MINIRKGQDIAFFQAEGVLTGTVENIFDDRVVVVQSALHFPTILDWDGGTNSLVLGDITVSLDHPHFWKEI